MSKKVENRFYVYMHVNKINGEPFYIGRGTGYRINQKTDRNSWWKNIVNKYGFDAIVIEEFLTSEKANELEKYWINRIGRKDLGLGPLVNLTDGGDGISGYKFSDETKLKMRLSNLGKKLTEEHKKNIGLKQVGHKKCLGHKLTEEHKQKISKGSLGIKKPRLKVMDTSTFKLYNSIDEAAKDLNLVTSTLYRYLKGSRTNKTTLKYTE